MSDTPANPPERARSRMGCLGTLTVISVALIAAGTVLFLSFSDTIKQSVSTFTQGFFKTEIKQESRDVILEIGRTHGDHLEIASPMQTTEIFNKTDTRYAAWGWLNLGTSVSEVKVPATYRFHIKLSEMKHARLENGVLTVHAPFVRPSLPVAVDTSKLEKKSEGGWLRFDADQQLAALERTITPALNIKAEQHLATVKEHARRDIEDFVQKWVVETHPIYQNQVQAIKIIFPGEQPAEVKSTPLLP